MPNNFIVNNSENRLINLQEIALRQGGALLSKKWISSSEPISWQCKLAV